MKKGHLTKTEDRFHDQILSYYPFVRKIALSIAKTLPSNIEADDLISAGVIGLIDAISKFDSSRDDDFKAYAYHRIKGSIYDDLRDQSLISRYYLETSKRIDEAKENLRSKSGETPSDGDISSYLGISAFRLSKAKLATVARQSSDIDINRLEMATDSDSFDLISRKEEKEILDSRISQLPLRLGIIITGHYYCGLQFKQIAKEQNLSPSMISILHEEALTLLRRGLDPSI